MTSGACSPPLLTQRSMEAMWLLPRPASANTDFKTRTISGVGAAGRDGLLAGPPGVSLRLGH